MNLNDEYLEFVAEQRGFKISRFKTMPEYKKAYTNADYITSLALDGKITDEEFFRLRNELCLDTWWMSY